MNPQTQTETDILIDNLTLRDVPYFAGSPSSETPLISDEVLLTGMVSDGAARLQMALIPLLLRHPELSDIVPKVVANLPTSEQTVLKLYYTATVILQTALANELESLLGPTAQLRDWYSEDLGVNGESVEERLTTLAMYHAHFSGLDINWIGTYRHSAKYFIRRLHLRKRWKDLS